LIVRNAGISVKALKCFEPHMHIGSDVNGLLPKGTEPKSEYLAARLRAFLLDSQRQIANNAQEEGCAANMLWVWSPSNKAVWPSFAARTGWKAAVVGGLDFLHGIAMAANMHWDPVPGATGYIDTDYAAKAAFAIRYMDDFDFVLVHVNAADEEAHQRNHNGKIKAIEQTDRLLVGPILYELHKRSSDDFRIVVCGDHMTRCWGGKHTNAPVPYALYGKGIPCSNASRFSESNCISAKLTQSLNFLEHILLRETPT
jgi:2,3-bisphosphoglycerate-independent phosphoglycerate mutase